MAEQIRSTQQGSRAPYRPIAAVHSPPLKPEEFDDSLDLEPEKKTRTQSTLQSIFRHAKRIIIASAVHCPSIAVTLGILSLTFKQKFWTTPSSGTNTILNVLQFAAQLHGSLIIWSLSAIVLYVVNRGLRSSNGLAQGFLSSSFQLNSLSYVFRSEFWSGARQKRTRDKVFIVFFLSIFLLALALQPSSAIAMIPRLQFWPSDVYPRNAIQFRAYIQASQKTLYPAVLTSSNANAGCSSGNGSTPNGCPSDGFSNILANDNVFSGSASTLNFTMDSGWNRQLIGTASNVNVNIQSTYSLRTLANFVGNALRSYSTDLERFSASITNTQNILKSHSGDLLRHGFSLRSQEKDIPIKRPLVVVECAGYAAGASTIAFPYSHAASDWIIPAAQFRNLSRDTNSEAVNFTWIDSAQFTASRPSLLGVFGTPTVHTSNNLPTGVGGGNNTFTFYGCTIMAYWEATILYYDTQAGVSTVYDLNPNGGTTYETIQVQPEFAKYLDVPFAEGSITKRMSNRTTMQALGEKCITSTTQLNSTLSSRQTLDPMATLQCLQMSIATYVADALSRVQDIIPAYFVASGSDPKDVQYYYYKDIQYVQNLYNMTEAGAPEELRYQGLVPADFKDTERFIEICMPISRYGYGYGFSQSTLIYVAVVILLVHVAVCLAHIIWIAVSNDGTELGWDTAGELMACLLRTPAAERGIPLLKTKKQFSDRLIVRKMSDEDTATSLQSLSIADPKLERQRTSLLRLRRIPATIPTSVKQSQPLEVKQASHAQETTTTSDERPTTTPSGIAYRHTS